MTGASFLLAWRQRRGGMAVPGLAWRCRRAAPPLRRGVGRL